MEYRLAKGLFEKSIFQPGTKVTGDYVSHGFGNVANRTYHGTLVVVSAKDTGNDILLTVKSDSTTIYRTMYTSSITRIDGMDVERLSSCFGLSTSLPPNIEKLVIPLPE